MDFGFLAGNIVELTITGLVVGGIYALVALGYTLVYGVLQLINFAHADVMMWGTFAVAWTFTLMTQALGTGGISTDVAGALPYLLVSLVVAAAVSGGMAMLVERVAYRRLVRRRAPTYVILISAIGASFVLSETIGIRDHITGLFGLSDILKDYVNNPRGIETLAMRIKPHELFEIGNYTVKDIDVIILLAALIMMIGLDFFIRQTKLGRQIRAVAQDPEAAALMGTNSTSVVRITFLIGGIMAGVAAVLYMLKYSQTKFDLSVVLGTKAFTAAVLGGIGNLRGALLGGILLGVVENYGAAVFGSQWKDIVAFVLLVLILLVRPTGLLGQSLGRARA